MVMDPWIVIKQLTQRIEKLEQEVKNLQVYHTTLQPVHGAAHYNLNDSSLPPIRAINCGSCGQALDLNSNSHACYAPFIRYDLL